MSDPLAVIAAWWRGGDLLMPVMAAVALVLYAILVERSVVLWGVRRRERRDELLALLRQGHGDRDPGWRLWAARFVGLSEAEQLSRGFAVSRALITVLPLLGLFGTVTGMIGTFGSLGFGGGQGTAIARQASGGIALALTATQYGMALAVPAMLWHWLLSRRVDQLVQHREQVIRNALQEPGQA
jgi:biopolymer transport protein ExbB/TolQ